MADDLDRVVHDFVRASTTARKAPEFVPKVKQVGRVVSIGDGVAHVEGLRDIAVLADLIARAVKQGADPGAADVLDAYANMRKQDIRSITLATDGLARLFSNPLTGIALARSAGLVATDLLPGIRHRIARHAMGVRGHLPQLGRGLPLE